jgi:hypothetical protein
MWSTRSQGGVKISCNRDWKKHKEIIIESFLVFLTKNPILNFMNQINSIEQIIETIESLKQRNLYIDARETALQALSKHTDDYRLYEELADIYLFENNLEKAEEVISYARALHPASGTGIYLE